MWGWILLFIGIAYGYMTPGKQDKSRLFWKGLIIGLVAAVVLTLIGWVTNSNPVVLGDTGFWGFIWGAILLTLAFIVGVFIGDLFDRRRGHAGRAMRRV